MTHFSTKAFRRKDSKANLAHAVDEYLNSFENVIDWEVEYEVHSDGEQLPTQHYAMVVIEHEGQHE